MITKIFLQVLLFSSLSFSAFCQTTVQESAKIATFCKVWGFLKYYHPVIAKGKFDWDSEFTSRVKILDSLNSKDEINRFYSQWIIGLGEVKKCKKCDNQIPDSLKFNLDLTWLSDTSVFTNTVIHQLLYIQQNRNQGKNRYVNQHKNIGNTRYNKEKAYKDSIFPSEELRLLGLSRYWNIINYFYPYKYLTDQNWDSVLVEMIPKFKDAEDTVWYHLAMLELTAKINDSHARFSTVHTVRYFGLKWAPFNYKVIDNKAIVTGFFNDTFCKKNDILIGDVFLSVDNISIEDVIKSKSKYVGASNEATKLRKFQYGIFNGQTDSFTVGFERNGTATVKTVYRYYSWDMHYRWLDQNTREAYKVLDGNIGYVDMGILQRKQVKKVLHEMKDTKAIIFDVRNYPKGTLYKIAKFLNAEKVPFAKFTRPDMSYPGVYHYTAPYHCGKKNKNPYKGKVVLLLNESSQSHAEFTLMALQTAPDVIGIGSQTAGADGNVSEITFPGNYKTKMTGIGVYYPDGRETQRIGIVPDIEVKPTIEGLRMGKDEVLEKALEIINYK